MDDYLYRQYPISSSLSKLARDLFMLNDTSWYDTLIDILNLPMVDDEI